MARRRNKGEERHIAAQRVDRLLALARDEALGPDAELADRYARLARRIAMRYQSPLRPDQKAQVCRDCGAYRVPGRNTRVRIQAGRIITTCLTCAVVRRRPLHGPPRKQRRTARTPHLSGPASISPASPPSQPSPAMRGPRSPDPPSRSP